MTTAVDFKLLQCSYRVWRGAAAALLRHWRLSQKKGYEKTIFARLHSDSGGMTAFKLSLRCSCLASLALLCLASPLIRPQSSAHALRVTVRYPASNLQQNQALFLRGDSCGLSWSQGVRLNKLSVADSWSVSLTCEKLLGDIVSMKVLVDDNVWSLGCNMISPASALDVVLYPWFYSATGHYEYIRDVRSPQLRNSRDIVVYLPPSYAENTLKSISNVLVMHDGQNLFNESTSAFGCWHCDQTADANIMAGAVEELVIVGVDNTDDRTNELTYASLPLPLLSIKHCNNFTATRLIRRKVVEARAMITLTSSKAPCWRLCARVSGLWRTRLLPWQAARWAGL